ncbi:GNAT family N-acetyltransferase [Kistimonas asteriae]|uniref:GNAT family N-acetyltransferase n=1 Tax=Kistimonas asteriae TaxID=517724 RepID=UPI001BA57057|nr:GNAT family protein [Kistimonas asteriae]
MKNNNWLSDVTLNGNTVELQPLIKEHAADLVAASSDGNLWNLWFTGVPCQETINSYIEFALTERDAGRSIPFVVYHKKDRKIIGSTRFCNATPENKRLEIGYTWYSKSYQKSSVNTECKLLLLNHAFESLSAIAVEFRTHWHNQASRAAISRLGAKQDGVLRNHAIDQDGCYRDTVVFSIIDHEWPVVLKNLKHRLSINRS